MSRVAVYRHHSFHSFYKTSQLIFQYFDQLNIILFCKLTWWIVLIQEMLWIIWRCIRIFFIYCFHKNCTSSGRPGCCPEWWFNKNKKLGKAQQTQPWNLTLYVKVSFYSTWQMWIRLLITWWVTEGMHWLHLRLTFISISTSTMAAMTVKMAELVLWGLISQDWKGMLMCASWIRAMVPK